jgi:Ca-activated chloride channel family protein
VTPIDKAHLVDPAQPRTLLGLPDPRVLAAIKTAWHEDRKAANVAVVVDTSGSMREEDKLVQAQQGLRVFMRQFSPRDRVGLVTFADDVNLAVPVDTVARNRSLLASAVDNLNANGGTAVYDATARAVDLIAALHDTTRINAVVVLTDGADTASTSTIGKLLARMRAQSESEVRNVRVFTIAYGKDANKSVLHSIADASGGKDYTGDPKEIAGVYRQISSFF